MTRFAILAVCVVVVGCGDSSQRQRVVDRQSRFDSLMVESQMAHRRAMAALDHGMSIIDGALDRAERDSVVMNELNQRAVIIDTLSAVGQRMAVRIDRLVADSVRCADQHVGDTTGGVR